MAVAAAVVVAADNASAGAAVRAVAAGFVAVAADAADAAVAAADDADAAARFVVADTVVAAHAEGK